MKLGQILREQQPEVYHKLNEKCEKHKRKERKQEHLSFSYIKNELMSHDSYERHRGAVTQRRWGR